VVSVLSLHRWERPDRIFAEIERVRRKDSVVMIADFSRDKVLGSFSVSAGMFGLGMGKINSRNLKNSLRSSYTVEELEEMIRGVGITNWDIKKNGRLLSVMTPSAPSADDA
jgi:ubiquinone/menaquinone biosynthesis C-methylase UbiE